MYSKSVIHSIYFVINKMTVHLGKFSHVCNGDVLQANDSSLHILGDVYFP